MDHSEKICKIRKTAEEIVDVKLWSLSVLYDNVCVLSLQASSREAPDLSWEATCHQHQNWEGDKGPGQYTGED